MNMTESEINRKVEEAIQRFESAAILATDEAWDNTLQAEIAQRKHSSRGTSRSFILAVAITFILILNIGSFLFIKAHNSSVSGSTERNRLIANELLINPGGVAN